MESPLKMPMIYCKIQIEVKLMEMVRMTIEALQVTLGEVAYHALGIGILIAILFEAKHLIKSVIYRINRRQ